MMTFNAFKLTNWKKKCKRPNGQVCKIAHITAIGPVCGLLEDDIKLFAV